ncbi:putative quinol monooxygenase [Kiloniella laminariae]|uniref:Quinol monooxygenase n=1 Tax=Kiloniella laminariae TaxID=454162 RepID=A0ABT4LI60_9PROT|nr:putative quinol monooxygenase [Kiloniella laminariae]MCZ4279687.1 putative quinol monooxygenase [Kiloniella laminariae]
MSDLTIIANIQVKRDKLDLVKAELQKLIPITRAEKGCLQYDLHQDNDDPCHFVFVENWTSRALWQDHMQAPHLAAFIAATEGTIENMIINEMTLV